MFREKKWAERIDDEGRECVGLVDLRRIFLGVKDAGDAEGEAEVGI